MTILLGPCPCHGCGAPVTVVRRPPVLTGHAEGCGRYHPPCVSAESQELREVVTIEADRARHLCGANRA